MVLGLGLIQKATDLIPDGNVGLAIKVGLSLAGVIWWSSGPGAEEAR